MTLVNRQNIILLIYGDIVYIVIGGDNYYSNPNANDGSSISRYGRSPDGRQLGNWSFDCSAFAKGSEFELALQIIGWLR